ncbi:MAG: hypothetical protein JWP83_2577 [Mycobacterium sp.]|jgi:hypothetical protein|nr:hypothetical protein [Mycobacterium sp.]
MKADVGDWRVIKSGTVGHRDRSKRPFSQAIPGRSWSIDRRTRR